MLPSLELVDNVVYLERGPQFEGHVLHHHVRVEEQQRFAVDLLRELVLENKLIIYRNN